MMRLSRSPRVNKARMLPGSMFEPWLTRPDLHADSTSPSVVATGARLNLIFHLPRNKRLLKRNVEHEARGRCIARKVFDSIDLEGGARYFFLFAAKVDCPCPKGDDQTCIS